MSMIVILPFKGESIAGVLNHLSKISFSSVIKNLEDAEQEFVDEDVHVYLPKFKISSDFVLNSPLENVIIKTCLQPISIILLIFIYIQRVFFLYLNSGPVLKISSVLDWNKRCFQKGRC